MVPFRIRATEMKRMVLSEAQQVMHLRRLLRPANQYTQNLQKTLLLKKNTNTHSNFISTNIPNKYFTY